MDSYQTIEKESQGEYKENRSRFIAFAFPINNQEEVKPLLEKIKKEYFDARHHCYAYRIIEKDKEVKRCFDDREPSHTAGDRIYAAIESNNLNNILIIVVRYFGGVLLGASNLSRAYRQAAIEAINNANIITNKIQEEVVFSYSYTDTAKINRFFKENRIDKTSYIYIESTTIKIKLTKEQKKSLAVLGIIQQDKKE